MATHICAPRRAPAVPVDTTRRFRMQRVQTRGPFPMRPRFWRSLALVAALLCTVVTADREQGAEPAALRRQLMPIADDADRNSSAYHYDTDDYHDSKDDASNNGSSKQVIIGVSIGGALLIITVCLTWKACMECCTRSNRRTRHRAYIERSNAGWKCEICSHVNDFSQSECVLCGSPAEKEINIIQSRREETSASVISLSRADISSHSISNYLMLSSPRIGVSRAGSKLADEDLNERQLVARERHEWKRCIGGQHVRWVNVPFADLREDEVLRGVVIQERPFQEWQKQHRPQIHSSQSQISVSSSTGPQLSWFTPKTAFVRDDSHLPSGTVRWRLAEEFSVSSRLYFKNIMRIAAMPFAEKAQWFYQYALKTCSTIVDGYHTIRIHREKVLKQSLDLIMAAPTSTLHRRLRVDFMDEAGVDGGGILREWLHLVCNDLFAEQQGLFKLTNSSSHQGYWIHRTHAKKCGKHLEMYVFFGKILAKALLEGLLLNVRLAIPLLKHILGVPFTLSDLYLLDETVYSSMMWILENDNTNALSLNFTVEGVELIPSGADITLHDGNKHLYVAKVMQYYLFDSVQTEIASIMEGFRSVISDTVLHVFDFKELDLLLSGLPQINAGDWRQHTEVRFYQQSNSEFELVGWFWEIVESFTQAQRSRLLQYVTGSSGVPVEGFKGLTGMDGEIQLFTLQLGKNISTEYTVLPHASTCLNRLDLPLYSSKAELEKILLMVIDMDVTGFSSR